MYKIFKKAAGVVAEKTNRIFEECTKIAVEDGIINPWNFSHPYHNDYVVGVEREQGTFAEILYEVSSGKEIFRVVSWFEGVSVEIQGILTYRGWKMVEKVA